MLKKSAITILLICILLMVSVFMISNHTKKSKSPEIRYISASYVINVNHLNEVVGFCDYVFVGYVEKMTGTRYDDSIPHTCYDVTVLNNIKGDLPLDTVVKVQKTGGLTKDSSQCFLMEGDSLPESGSYYVFTVKESDEDGLYTACGVHTTAFIDPVDIETDSGNARKTVSEDSPSFDTSNLFINSDVYQEYTEAYRNEIPFKRRNSQFLKE